MLLKAACRIAGSRTESRAKALSQDCRLRAAQNVMPSSGLQQHWLRRGQAESGRGSCTHAAFLPKVILISLVALLEIAVIVISLHATIHNCLPTPHAIDYGDKY